MDVDIKAEFAKFRTGSETAFRFFYDRYYHALCLCVHKILKDEQCVHDIVQEAFITLWRDRDILQSELHLKMFLYQVVRHRCLDYLKNKRVQEKYIREYLSVESEENYTNEVIEQEVHRMVIQEIEQLPEEQKKVVILHLEGKDNAEIAEILQISVNTVKTHKARARKTLKSKLDHLLVFIFLFGM